MDQEDALRALAADDPSEWGDILFECCGDSEFLQPNHFTGFGEEGDEFRNSLILKKYGEDAPFEHDDEPSYEDAMQAGQDETEMEYSDGSDDDDDDDGE